MFNAIEAINDIIDDINNENDSYNESCFEDIYESVLDKLTVGKLSVEEAESIIDSAESKYLYSESSMGEYKTITKEIKTNIREYSKILKQVKGMKKQDPGKAILLLENSKSKLEDTISLVESIPDDTPPNVISIIGTTIISAIGFAGIAAAASALFYGVGSAIDTRKFNKAGDIGRVEYNKNNEPEFIPEKLNYSKEAGRSIKSNSPAIAARSAGGAALGVAVGIGARALKGDMSTKKQKSVLISNLRKEIKACDKLITKLSK